MKVSGFTIVSNAIIYDYPAQEAINAILPICDEFIVNVGDSRDNTLKLIKSIKDPKIKIIQPKWDLSQKPHMLSYQTNLALKECSGDWAFYVQTDELFHEADLPFLKVCMQKYLHDDSVDAFRFQWLHFYGSYYRYRIDRGWYQKQDRIIRNNGEVESCEDAYTFRRKDGKPLRSKKTYKLLYHYGWVHNKGVMTKRRTNLENMGIGNKLTNSEREEDYNYGDLNRFPIYFGTHPKVMADRIAGHELSQKDWDMISKKYWWNPLKAFRVRYKTPKRIKTRIE